MPSIVVADRLVPFFRPSTGGGIDGGAGVPSAAGVPAAGVPALESDALSPLELAAVATLPDGAGELIESFGSVDSFDAGDSSSPESALMSLRSLEEGTVNVTSKPALPPDFRRPSAAFGGIVSARM